MPIRPDSDFRLRRRAETALRRRQRITDYGDFLSTLRDWSWFGTFTYRSQHPSDYRLPRRDWALAKAREFLHQLENAAGQPIAWVMADDLGALGGRIHCHVLIAGVDKLNIYYWRDLAFHRFGRSQLAVFQDDGGAPYYIAQNGLSETGDLEFGGTLWSRGAKETVAPQTGRIVVAQSAEVPSALYRMTLGRRRKR